METEVDEKVKVWAFFDLEIFPISILWRRRYIKFDKVIFRSSKKIGDVRLVDLVCSANDANYMLEYNTSNYLWKVKKVMAKD